MYNIFIVIDGVSAVISKQRDHHSARGTRGRRTLQQNDPRACDKSCDARLHGRARHAMREEEDRPSAHAHTLTRPSHTARNDSRPLRRADDAARQSSPRKRRQHQGDGKRSVYPLQAVAGALKLMMGEKRSALRLAPPTRAPSMSGHDMRSSTLAGLTLPPYWMMTASATSCE